jgi:hypothetical protein
MSTADEERRHERRPRTNSPERITIDALVGLCVVAHQRGAIAKAAPRETACSAEPHPNEVRRLTAGRAKEEHVIVRGVEHFDDGGTGSREARSAIEHELEDRIDVEARRADGVLRFNE